MNKNEVASAAGLTSGLAAIGGGMVGGNAVLAIAPLVGAVLGGYIGYKALGFGKSDEAAPSETDQGSR